MWLAPTAFLAIIALQGLHVTLADDEKATIAGETLKIMLSDMLNAVHQSIDENKDDLQVEHTGEETKTAPLEKETLPSKENGDKKSNLENQPPPPPKDRLKRSSEDSSSSESTAVKNTKSLYKSNYNMKLKKGSTKSLDSDSNSDYSSDDSESKYDGNKNYKPRPMPYNPSQTSWPGPRMGYEYSHSLHTLKPRHRRDTSEEQSEKKEENTEEKITVEITMDEGKGEKRIDDEYNENKKVSSGDDTTHTKGSGLKEKEGKQVDDQHKPPPRHQGSGKHMNALKPRPRREASEEESKKEELVVTIQEKTFEVEKTAIGDDEEYKNNEHTIGDSKHPEDSTSGEKRAKKYDDKHVKPHHSNGKRMEAPGHRHRRDASKESQEVELVVEKTKVKKTETITLNNEENDNNEHSGSEQSKSSSEEKGEKQDDSHGPPSPPHGPHKHTGSEKSESSSEEKGEKHDDDKHVKPQHPRGPYGESHGKHMNRPKQRLRRDASKEDPEGEIIEINIKETSTDDNQNKEHTSDEDSENSGIKSKDCSSDGEKREKQDDDKQGPPPAHGQSKKIKAHTPPKSRSRRDSSDSDGESEDSSSIDKTEHNVAISEKDYGSNNNQADEKTVVTITKKECNKCSENKKHDMKIKENRGSLMSWIKNKLTGSSSDFEEIKSSSDSDENKSSSEGSSETNKKNNKNHKSSD